MTFNYLRTVRLADTDAAGVVYFVQALSMCHEAYEESLARAGVDLKAFFDNPATAIPIVHTEMDFLKPMFAGDRLTITLTPESISESEFEINYQIVNDSSSKTLLATAKTRHVCIDPLHRRRASIPEFMRQWLMLL